VFDVGHLARVYGLYIGTRKLCNHRSSQLTTIECFSFYAKKDLLAHISKLIQKLRPQILLIYSSQVLKLLFVGQRPDHCTAVSISKVFLYVRSNLVLCFCRFRFTFQFNERSFKIFVFSYWLLVLILKS